MSAVRAYLQPITCEQDNRLFVKTTVNDHEFDFLIDTGAQATLMPSATAKNFGLPLIKTANVISCDRGKL